MVEAATLRRDWQNNEYIPALRRDRVPPRQRRRSSMLGGGTIEDQLGIRELIERYSDACCVRDAEAIGALWAEDGRWGVSDMPELESHGKAAILERWTQGQALFPFVFLLCIPGRIDIDGDTATARTYTTEILTAANGTGRKAAGRYDDRFTKASGRWLFAQRVWTPLHQEGDYVHGAASE
ncbi:MAG TPA: nuclear transport factor 2 family protein [Stellaceae bacterium]|nr:nuclear transport factor 2 family protein [Stellaceae bacterium]